MNIEVKISKLRIPYKKAIYDLEKRVEDVKKGLKKELICINILAIPNLVHSDNSISYLPFNKVIRSTAKIAVRVQT